MKKDFLCKVWLQIFFQFSKVKAKFLFLEERLGARLKLLQNEFL